MKKSILLPMLMAIALASCTEKKSSSKPVDTFATENITFDRFGIASSDTKCIVRLDVDFPTGLTALDSTVRNWIFSTMNENSGVIDTMLTHKPSTNLTDGKTVIDLIGFNLISISVDEFEDVQHDFYEQLPGYEYFYSYKNAYGNDSIITYKASLYTYLGGAHGSQIDFGASFDRQDARRLTWNDLFVPGYKDKLIPLIKKGLMSQYFQVDTEAELADQLLVNLNEFPLPAYDPCLVADGVEFTYQQYEIAPYSAGLPSCTIPYSELKGIFR